MKDTDFIKQEQFLFKVSNQKEKKKIKMFICFFLQTCDED